MDTSTIKEEILFVTAFLNINRSSWKKSGRSNEEYFKQFRLLADNIEYNLVVYLEDNIKEKLLANHTFKSNIIFLDASTVNTFLNKYLDADKLIISSEIYKKKIPRGRKHLPEHIYSQYNLITNSKINFINNAKNIYPNYLFYSWVDFGYMKDHIENLPKNINLAKLPEKIIFHSFKRPTNRIDPNKLLQTGESFLSGGSFIIHRSLIDKLEHLFEDKIKAFHNMYVSDDDQAIILQIYYDNPELFHLVITNKWCSLYYSL